MKMLADDDLEDDSLDPRDIPAQDLTRQVRKLAAAVLVQAVIDSKAGCYWQEAAAFLYPQSEAGREHLGRLAELAGVSSAWLNECLAKSAGMPLPTIRKCTKCKTALPIGDFAPRYDGDPGRYCGRCRELTPIHPSKRRFGRSRSLAPR